MWPRRVRNRLCSVQNVTLELQTAGARLKHRSSTSGALPLLSPAPNDAWAVAATLGFSSFGFLASRFLCCPRAKIMQRICHDVLKELGIKDSPLLEVAMALVDHRRSGTFLPEAIRPTTTKKYLLRYCRGRTIIL